MATSFRRLLAQLRSVETDNDERLDHHVMYNGAELLDIVLVADDDGRLIFVSEWKQDDNGE